MRDRRVARPGRGRRRLMFVPLPDTMPATRSEDIDAALARLDAKKEA